MSKDTHKNATVLHLLKLRLKWTITLGATRTTGGFWTFPKEKNNALSRDSKPCTMEQSKVRSKLFLIQTYPIEA